MSLYIPRGNMVAIFIGAEKYRQLSVNGCATENRMVANSCGH